MPHTRRRMLRPVSNYSAGLLAQGLADIIQAGGYGALGSHGQQHGLRTHWDIWINAMAMKPMEPSRWRASTGPRCSARKRT